jgi:molecular chaperone Hsp33
MSDLLKRYLFEDRSVRVQAVRLKSTWRDAQQHHDYPPPIRRLLGEMIAASTLLAANLKFEGSLVMQIQGDGPVALLVVECRADLSLRATVKLRPDSIVPEDGTLQSLLNSHGKGRFIVVLDPKSKDLGQQAYQGIVPIEGDTVAQALEHYMKSSEQLDTRLWLTADDQQVAGLLLQRLPENGGLASEPSDGDTWERACHLAATLGGDELLKTETDEIIHRLFWEETLRVFEPSQVRWHCPCNREKVADMLRMLGRAEVEDIIEERGEVDVTCDFCGKPYQFDAVDCAALFVPPTQIPPEQGPPTVH